MVRFSSSWHQKWEHDKDPFVALTSQIKLEENPEIRQAVYPPPSHNAKQEHGSHPHHKMTYSLILSLGNGVTTTKGLSHRTPINKHLLNIKITGNYRIVNFLFQESREDSGCANKSGCVILLHSEREKYMYIHSKVKWQAIMFYIF